MTRDDRYRYSGRTSLAIFVALWAGSWLLVIFGLMLLANVRIPV